jgi:hypothetical protein
MLFRISLAVEVSERLKNSSLLFSIALLSPCMQLNEASAVNLYFESTPMKLLEPLEQLISRQKSPGIRANHFVLTASRPACRERAVAIQYSQHSFAQRLAAFLLRRTNPGPPQAIPSRSKRSSHRRTRRVFLMRRALAVFLPIRGKAFRKVRTCCRRQIPRPAQ